MIEYTILIVHGACEFSFFLDIVNFLYFFFIQIYDIIEHNSNAPCLSFIGDCELKYAQNLFV